MEKRTKVHRHIRPLVLIAAVLGVGAASFVTANAATDGALAEKLTMFIDGKEVDAEVRMVSQDDSTVVYEVVADDGESDGETNEKIIQFVEGEDYVGVEYENSDGDSMEDFEIIYEFDDSSE